MLRKKFAPELLPWFLVQHVQPIGPIHLVVHESIPG